MIDMQHIPAQTQPTSQEIAQVQPTQNPAAAKLGLKGNYLGVNINPGITSGGKSGENAALGGGLSGRYAIPNTQLSIRPSVLFSHGTTVTIPRITYDIPVAKNTNVYAGGGYSFIGTQGKNTSLGNKNAPVISAGVETAINKNFVAYGGADLGLNAYKNSDRDAAALEAGVGYRF